MPILDAFSIGCPVVTSNASSMPEVGGNAALYVNPEKAEDIKEQLNLLMRDSTLREDMIKKGFQRAKEFSWQKAAMETSQVYQKVLKNG